MHPFCKEFSMRELVTIVHLENGNIMQTGINGLKEQGLPEGYVDAESIPTELWVQLVQNLRRQANLPVNCLVASVKHVASPEVAI